MQKIKIRLRKCKFLWLYGKKRAEMRRELFLQFSGEAKTTDSWRSQGEELESGTCADDAKPSYGLEIGLAKLDVMHTIVLVGCSAAGSPMALDLNVAKRDVHAVDVATTAGRMA